MPVAYPRFCFVHIRWSGTGEVFTKVPFFVRKINETFLSHNCRLNCVKMVLIKWKVLWKIRWLVNKIRCPRLSKVSLPRKQQTDGLASQSGYLRRMHYFDLRIFQRDGLKLGKYLIFPGLVQNVYVYRMAKSKKIWPFRWDAIRF